MTSSVDSDDVRCAQRWHLVLKVMTWSAWWHPVLIVMTWSVHRDDIQRWQWWREVFTEMTFCVDSEVFRPGRSTVEQSFSSWVIIEKHLQYKRDLFHNFKDFKQAFDRVLLPGLLQVVRSFNIDEGLVQAIQALYENSSGAVLLNSQLREFFKITVGVRQECLLSPILFNLFQEKTTRPSPCATYDLPTTSLLWAATPHSSNLLFKPSSSLLPSLGYLCWKAFVLVLFPRTALICVADLSVEGEGWRVSDGRRDGVREGEGKEGERERDERERDRETETERERREGERGEEGREGRERERERQTGWERAM